MMGTAERNLRVLMLPWLAHGHISPCLELAKRLANRNIFVYICSTPINLSSIKNKITDEYSPSIQLVDLRLPFSPELPDDRYFTTNGLPLHLNPTLTGAFKAGKSTFSNILESLCPDVLIHDVILRWAASAASAASSYDIPSVSFLTSGAAMCSYFVHKMMRRVDVEFPFPAVYLRDFEFAKIRYDSERDDADNKESMQRRRTTSTKPVMLIKTCREIEGKFIDYLSDLFNSSWKILPTGPLVQEPVQEKKSDTPTTIYLSNGAKKTIHLIDWLNKKNPNSTVFVSFGTEYFLTKEEMEEIANGLELSQVNFIWVLRVPLGEKIGIMEETLPEGFVERVKERGLMVEGWASQATILGHESIGGFVSHCGWNSAMECMNYGVPVIAIPMHLEQPLNARVLVELGVCLEVVRDENGGISREEVARVIREVVIEKGGEGVRRKSTELSERIRSKGNDEEIDGVVKELFQLCQTRMIPK